MANTGNIIVTERDTNPFSPTYDTTRERTYADIYRCIPEGNLDFKVKAILNGTYTGELTVDCNHVPSGLNNSTTLVESEVFNRKSSIINCIVGECVTWIDEHTFENCSNMETIYISNTVYYIDDYVFFNCEKLTEVNIPNSVQHIGVEVFNNCDRLREVTIGTGITSIYQGAFYNCPLLTSVTIKATTPPPTVGRTSTQSSGDVRSLFAHYDTPPVIYVPAESLTAYRTHEKWSAWASNIQPIPS